jgi:hypothetical protein
MLRKRYAQEAKSVLPSAALALEDLKVGDK